MENKKANYKLLKYTHKAKNCDDSKKEYYKSKIDFYNNILKKMSCYRRKRISPCKYFKLFRKYTKCYKFFK